MLHHENLDFGSRIVEGKEFSKTQRDRTREEREEERERDAQLSENCGMSVETKGNRGLLRQRRYDMAEEGHRKKEGTLARVQG